MRPGEDALVGAHQGLQDTAHPEIGQLDVVEDLPLCNDLYAGADVEVFRDGPVIGALQVADGVPGAASGQGDLTSFCKYYDNNSRNDIKEKFQGVKFTIGYEF